MNIEKLKSLLGGDKNMVNRFLEIFKNEMPTQLSQLENAIEEEDWDTASNTAHSIKSQVVYLDLTEISELAFRIERDAEQRNNLENLIEDFEHLEKALEEVIKNFP